MRERKKTGKRAGFTLVEIMIVIAIIGMITSIVAVNVLRQRGKANVDAAKIAIKNIRSAVILFYSDNGRYPDGLEEIAPIVEGGMETLKDPWGHEYIYEVTYGDPPFNIYSLGADGAPGGEGEAQDIYLNSGEGR